VLEAVLIGLLTQLAWIGLQELVKLLHSEGLGT
jgi:hypothetical protein